MNAEKSVPADTSIRVRTVGHDEPMQFEVAVQDREGEVHYLVTMSHADFERLGGGNAAPEACVRAAFLFLLDREPKESILRRFRVSVIEQYFPEFYGGFPRYLDARPSLR